MNVVKEIQKITDAEQKLGVSLSGSWHAQYGHSRVVFVGNLDYQLSEGDVLAIMSQYGEIEKVNLVRDPDTGKSKGFAFVTYDDFRSTVLAVDNLNGFNILSRTIRVDHVADYTDPVDRESSESDSYSESEREVSPQPKEERRRHKKRKRESKKEEGKKSKRKHHKKHRRRRKQEEEEAGCEEPKDGSKEGKPVVDGERKAVDADSLEVREKEAEGDEVNKGVDEVNKGVDEGRLKQIALQTVRDFRGGTAPRSKDLPEPSPVDKPWNTGAVGACDVSAPAVQEAAVQDDPGVQDGKDSSARRRLVPTKKKSKWEADSDSDQEK